MQHDQGKAPPACPRQMSGTTWPEGRAPKGVTTSTRRQPGCATSMGVHGWEFDGPVPPGPSRQLLRSWGATPICAFRTAPPFGTHEDQSSVQPFAFNPYSVNLPLLCHLRCHPGHRPSEVPTLVTRYCGASRRHPTDRAIAYAYPGCPGFSAARFQSRSLTRLDLSTDYRLTPHRGANGLMPLQTAP